MKNRIIIGFTNFWNNKKNKIIIIAIAIVLLILVLLLVFSKKFKDNRFALNSIYDVYPEEVRELYANIVSVSCNGDLRLDVKLNDKKTDIHDMNKNNLLDYLFSYLDKNNMLTDTIDGMLINNTGKKLFYGNINLLNSIKNYQYGDYIYDSDGNVVTRKKNTCVSTYNHVSHLYGYSWNESELSIDINVAYLKDGLLYNYSDKLLGDYNGDLAKLNDLMTNTSYYRFNYVRDGKKFKLNSVEWKSRS